MVDKPIYRIYAYSSQMEEEFELELDFPDEEGAETYCDIRNGSSTITGLYYYSKRYYGESK